MREMYYGCDTFDALPTTYSASAKDVYEEGTLVFPAVQVQRDYAPVEDIMRMCMARIRVPQQWHGDFLASLGAARIAERRLKALCEKYGKEEIKKFIRNWFDYSENIMRRAIEEPKLIFTQVKVGLWWI